jgi:hypothetical protein
MLQRHLGARFVSGSDRPAVPDARLSAVERRGELGARLRTAIALGDVSDIHELARALMRGSAAEAAMGEQISRLAAAFDFDGLRQLADSLAV